MRIKTRTKEGQEECRALTMMRLKWKRKTPNVHLFFHRLKVTSQRDILTFATNQKC
jgi:hypothetical protein